MPRDRAARDRAQLVHDVATARRLLQQWLLSAPPLRGARPTELTREFLAYTEEYDAA
jgi:hypothetical protein